jgi:hypothetical protein
MGVETPIPITRGDLNMENYNEVTFNRTLIFELYRIKENYKTLLEYILSGKKDMQYINQNRNNLFLYKGFFNQLPNLQKQFEYSNESLEEFHDDIKANIKEFFCYLEILIDIVERNEFDANYAKNKLDKMTRIVKCYEKESLQYLPNN